MTRSLRLVYADNKSSYQQLLEKDNSFTIHERNIQKLATELCKVINGVAPRIMSLVFPLKNDVVYCSKNKFITRNNQTVTYGTKTLSHLGPKIWALVPEEMKEVPSLIEFKRKIKQWKPVGCLVYIM